MQISTLVSITCPNYPYMNFFLLHNDYHMELDKHLKLQVYCIDILAVRPKKLFLVFF